MFKDIAAAALKDLHQGWVRRLRWHYDHYNFEYAGLSLKPPLIVIGESREKLGEWNGRMRALTISAHHILVHSWREVLGTLRHEMAHQYVEDVLGVAAPPHGEAFQEACRILRADPAPRAAADSLDQLHESSAERDRMLARVKELLALATSNNEHEAASAMRMANKYLLKYNLDLTELDRERRFATRWLGKCSARTQEYEYTIGQILQDHFFVLVIWAFAYDALEDKSGRVLEVAGTRENLDVAEYVYSYLTSLADSLWRQHKSSGKALGTRLQYLAGLMRGLQDKLDAQRLQLKVEAGLVWLGDPKLKDYYRHLYPRITNAGLTGVRRNAGFHAGISDGREITIRRGVGAKAANRGGLLGGPQS